jgi:cytochrome c oxidase subunit 3
MNTESGAPLAMQYEDAAQQRGAATLGMWIFLATEVLFFGVLFTSYLVSRLLHYDAFVTGSHHTDIVMGSLNTAVLLTSSLSMALAVRGSMLGRQRVTGRWLSLTLLLGLVFLGIKGYEYHHEYTEGLVPVLNFTYAGAHATGVELFFYLYFVITGLHALHLLIGVIVVGCLIFLNARGRFGRAYHTPVELSGLYWHFVDVVWVFLYPLFYLVARA